MRTMQFVGYSGAGKTTLIAKVLTFLRASGARVLVLKHHGHGGMPKAHPPFLEMNAQGMRTVHAQAPDSWIFLEHGASSVILISGEACYVYMHALSPSSATSSFNSATTSFNAVGRYPQCLETLDMRSYDWMLIEGFKLAPWPKFFLVRDVSDLQLFKSMPRTWSNVQAVLFPDALRLEEALRNKEQTTFRSVPFVRRDDLETIISIMMRTGGVYLDPTSLGHI